ncbi:nucleotidyltransferase domain-containing protein [Paenibacillus sp. MZ04-78.2]|uniref:nucleotidyltransferase domain-containing protein n=1 Tax=Paenibacillus sp. MZ04-78.2 TaxID=2962034 RepID=UPI0020B6D8B1|nr:nucleotidyltransferase domain-containing protein [Paenibacillus sp. MZ04-78.2]MCP3774454.1 nucleotidyltransferase domain-containing protein [Paenibacillus sp. MZ04-78.2]
MTDFRQPILEELYQIERQEQVRILYACESGSRAWGFPSKDSDYDVRFLYVRPVEWYLSIFDQRDVIERPISDKLDINGWDLKKALNLFRKSNPPLLEWLQSPIPYFEKFSAAERIRSMSPLTFSPKSCMYHYLNMAKGNYREYLQGEQVKIKKYFYVLRPVLACEWIERFHAMPPMEFDVLVDRLVPEGSELKQVILKLVERKMAGDEMDYEPRINPINEFLEQKMNHFERTAVHLNSAEGAQARELDGLFRAVLSEVWENR